jgi:hypothetical protein
MSGWFKSAKYSDKTRWINADNVSWVYVWNNVKPHVWYAVIAGKEIEIEPKIYSDPFKEI